MLSIATRPLCAPTAGAIRQMDPGEYAAFMARYQAGTDTALPWLFSVFCACGGSGQVSLNDLISNALDLASTPLAEPHDSSPHVNHGLFNQLITYGG